MITKYLMLAAFGFDCCTIYKYKMSTNTTLKDNWLRKRIQKVEIGITPLKSTMNILGFFETVGIL